MAENKIAVGKSFRPGQLSNELVAAGHGGKVDTVRGLGVADEHGVHSSGEIAHDGTLMQEQADAVIDAHTPGLSIEQKLNSTKANNIIAALKAGNLDGGANPQTQKALGWVADALRGIVNEAPE